MKRGLAFTAVGASVGFLVVGAAGRVVDGLVAGRVVGGFPGTLTGGVVGGAGATVVGGGGTVHGEPSVWLPSSHGSWAADGEAAPRTRAPAITPPDSAAIQGFLRRFLCTASLLLRLVDGNTQQSPERRVEFQVFASETGNFQVRVTLRHQAETAAAMRWTEEHRTDAERGRSARRKRIAEGQRTEPHESVDGVAGERVGGDTVLGVGERQLGELVVAHEQLGGR